LDSFEGFELCSNIYCYNRIRSEGDCQRSLMRWL